MNTETKLPAVDTNQSKVVSYVENDIQKLHEIACKIKENCAEINTKQTELLKLQAELKQQLQDLQKEHEIFTMEEHKWKRKLEAVEYDSEKDFTADLTDQCCLLGYTLTDCTILEDGNTLVTLHYNNYCYIQFGTRANFYELVLMCPIHPRFAEIKEFLQRTQDMQGLLANVRKFFKIVINAKTCQP